MFKFFGQQQLGDQGEGHHQHGHVRRAQALLGQPHQAAAPQQQAHVKVEIAQLHQTHTLQGKHTQQVFNLIPFRPFLNVLRTHCHFEF